jgi:CRISPR-associated protein Cmr2
MVSHTELSNNYLIAAAVGPVQEFIAAARKLRDLWYGSYLLSELSKSVALSLHHQGCRLIFPAITDPDDLEPDSSLNVANKIMAETPDHADPEAILLQAGKDFKAFWQNLGEKACKTLRPDDVKNDLYRLQLNDFGEFFGAWVKWDTDYDTTRKALDRQLAGRKALRDFRPPAWNGHGLPKSSLDGAHESVLKNPALLVKRNILKRNEQLDALGIVKRLGPYTRNHRARCPHFDSFSETAVQPYIDGLKADMNSGRTPVANILQEISEMAAKAPLSQYLDEGRSFQRMECMAPPFPDDFFLMSRLEEWLRDHDLSRDRDWLKLKQKIAGELYRRTREPQPYAALMVGDGDFMGRTINQLKEIERHREFSTALSRFAASVGDVIANHDGRLIYSGGDDVMAYLPLHRMLACAVAVNGCFGEHVTRACQKLGVQDAPTFSMGVAIVHHLMPLYEALMLARHAESHAKNDGGRNALSVIQAKRSGAPLTITGKWNAHGNLRGVPERLAAMIQWYEDGKLPSRLGYNLKMTARVCGGEMRWNQTAERLTPANPPASEALRVVLRKRGAMMGTAFTQAEAETLLNERTNMGALANELIVAHQLAQAGLMAQGKWKRQQEDA